MGGLLLQFCVIIEYNPSVLAEYLYFLILKRNLFPIQHHLCFIPVVGRILIWPTRFQAPVYTSSPSYLIMVLL